MNGLGTFVVNLRTPAGIGIMIAVIAVFLFIIPHFLAPKKKRDVLQEIDEEETDNHENID
jgi:hypothetical protein